MRKFAQDYNEDIHGKVYALLLNAGISGMHDSPMGKMEWTTTDAMPENFGSPAKYFAD